MPLPARRLDAIAVLSYVDRFRDEYQAHIDLGRCPFDGESSLEGILAPSEMHSTVTGRHV